MSKKFNVLCLIFLALTVLMAAFVIKQFIASNFIPQGNTQNGGEMHYPESDLFQVEAIVLARSVTFNNFTTEKNLLVRFISEKMSYKNLVTVNLADSSETSAPKQLPAGKDLLSESVGLMLLYYLETDQKDAFLAHYKQAKSVLQKENGLFVWCQKPTPSSKSNASVDDLRILKALLMAKDKWQDSYFLKEATTISNGLLKDCVKDQQLLSFDSPTAPYAELFYFDFKAMYLAQKLDSRWSAVLTNALNKTMGLINTNQPLWVKIDASKDAYPLTENLLIYLHLTEVGFSSPSIDRWLLDKLETAALYGAYNKSGAPITAVESPSIYGITASIAKNNDNPQLYQAACKKLKQMQQQEPSEFTGGFVDTANRKAYSFDQLWGLLGY